MGLYTPTILGWYSYLSWFYDRGSIKDPAHTGTSTGISQSINMGPIRKSLPTYANVYVTIQGHGLSAGARTHYVTAKGRHQNSLPLITNLSQKFTQPSEGISYLFCEFCEASARVTWPSAYTLHSNPIPPTDGTNGLL